MMRLSKRLCVLLSAFALTSRSCAHSFYGRIYTGFHGYESRYVPGSEDMMTSKNMQEALACALDQAYTNPTPFFVYRYMVLQKKHMLKSERFAHVWKKVLWRHPELDTSITFPFMHRAQNVYKQEQWKKKEALLEEGRHHYLLVVCLEANNPYTHIVYGVAQRLQKEKRWHVGLFSAEPTSFSGVICDPEMIKQLHVEAYPAFYLVHLPTHTLTPIGSGVFSLYELIERMSEVLYEQKH